MTVVSEQEREAELPERWSAQAKTDVVLRLLRGERAVESKVRCPYWLRGQQFYAAVA
jgi:hypothetical protein